MTFSRGADPSDPRKNADEDGRFVRQQSAFRNKIEKSGRHAPEKGRYVLYIVIGCPWAQYISLFFTSKSLVARGFTINWRRLMVLWHWLMPDVRNWQLLDGISPRALTLSMGSAIRKKSICVPIQSTRIDILFPSFGIKSFKQLVCQLQMELTN